jgi:hypothetical protein
MTACVEAWHSMRVEFEGRAGFDGVAPLSSA